jgi:hypothetical protein
VLVTIKDGKINIRLRAYIAPQGGAGLVVKVEEGEEEEEPFDSGHAPLEEEDDASDAARPCPRVKREPTDDPVMPRSLVKQEPTGDTALPRITEAPFHVKIEEVHNAVVPDQKHHATIIRIHDGRADRGGTKREEIGDGIELLADEAVDALAENLHELHTIPLTNVSQLPTPTPEGSEAASPRHLVPITKRVLRVRHAGSVVRPN